MDIGINGNFRVIGNFVGSKKKWVKIPKTKFVTVFANDIKDSSRIFWEQNLKNNNTVFKHESIVDLVKKHKKGINIFPKNIEKLNKIKDIFLNFENRKRELIKIIIEAISPKEYKPPCHQGINKMKSELNKNRLLADIL